jgi:hypothetical protein
MAKGWLPGKDETGKILQDLKDLNIKNYLRVEILGARARATHVLQFFFFSFFPDVCIKELNNP